MLSLSCTLPIACRGEFDVDKYLVADDEATSESASSSSESGTTAESGSSGEITGESDSGTTESGTTTTTTDAECLDDEFDLGARCLSVVQVVELGSNAPTDLELADVDNSLTLDVVLAGAEVGFRLNDGVGNFGDAQSVTGPLASAIALGDFDGDGRADLATFPENGIYLYPNDDNGFGPPTMLMMSAVDGVFLDIEDDQGDELVLSGTSLRVIGGMLGTFSLVGEWPEHPGGALGRADVDGDEVLDILMAKPPSSSVVSARNDGVSLATPDEHVVNLSISAIAALDVDGDGTHEVLMTATDGHLYIHTAAALDAPPDSVMIGGEPNAIATGDLDGDGFDDVAIAKGDGQSIAILMHTGDSLGDPIDIGTNQPGDIPDAIAIGDLDDDNLADIVVGMTGSNRLVVFR